MDALPSIIPKSIVEVLNRLENDEDNLFSWKLTRSQDSFSLTVSCKLRAKTPNKAKDNNSEVTGRTTSAKLVRRRRRKKNQSPSALASSRKRHARFLEKDAVYENSCTRWWGYCILIDLKYLYVLRTILTKILLVYTRCAYKGRIYITEQNSRILLFLKQISSPC